MIGKGALLCGHYAPAPLRARRGRDARAHYRTNSNFFQCFSRYVRGVRGQCFRPLPPASGAPRPLRGPFSPHKCRNCGGIPRRASAGGAGGRPRSGPAWPSFRLAGGQCFRPLPHASGAPRLRGGSLRSKTAPAAAGARDRKRSLRGRSSPCFAPLLPGLIG